MRRLLILLALLTLPSVASAREGWRDWCWNGAKRVTTSGLNSTTTVQATTASCTVTIYVHGGSTLATIYSDNNNTPLANPFTGSNPNGQFIWYADNGRYDQTINVTINGASNTVTMSDVLLCDPYVTGSTCNNGGSTTAHNLLSTTHLDTIPESPPVRGDLITGQNQTSPTGVNPSWAALPLGTAGQVLLSNGLDALWGNLVAGSGITITNTGSPSGSTVTIASSGGGGCTLPGITDTAVVSEHPVSTCYDSTHWTWDDGSNKQNYQIGLTNVFTPGGFPKLAFLQGSALTLNLDSLASSSNVHLIGKTGTFLASGASGAFLSDIYSIGNNSEIRATNDASVFKVMCLMNGCDPFAGFGVFADGTGTGINTIFDVGNFNDVTAATASNTSSIFFIAEHSFAKSSAGCNSSDIFSIGENDHFTCSTASSASVDHIGSLGFFHTVTSVGHALSTSFVIGDTISLTQSSGGDITDLGAIGDTLTVTNCSHCYAFGANFTNSVSSSLALGMSSAKEVSITSGHVALAAHLDQSATGKFAGSCAMGAATTCTFSIAAAFSGTPLCVTSIDAASTVPATANVAKCSVSGTTVTITAGISNSLTWDAILIGNPN